jgi:hypothetical protein
MVNSTSIPPAAKERHQHRDQQPAGHGLGNPVGLERCDPCGQEAAEKIGEDRDDDRIRAIERDHAHRRFPAA